MVDLKKTLDGSGKPTIKILKTPNMGETKEYWLKYLGYGNHLCDVNKNLSLTIIKGTQC